MIKAHWKSPRLHNTRLSRKKSFFIILGAILLISLLIFAVLVIAKNENKSTESTVENGGNLDTSAFLTNKIADTNQQEALELIKNKKYKEASVKCVDGSYRVKNFKTPELALGYLNDCIDGVPYDELPWEFFSFRGILFKELNNFSKANTEISRAIDVYNNIPEKNDQILDSLNKMLESLAQ